MGRPPAFVTQWWLGLTSQEQNSLELSEPLALVNLAGVPDSVKQQIRGTDGPLDRAKMVQWAVDNWNNTSNDDFKNNCANFVSQSIHQGGVPFKSDPVLGFSGPDTWGWASDLQIPHLGIPGIDTFIDKANHFTHTDSWTSAGGLHDFLLKNGSQEVARSDVRPGDVVFYTQSVPADGKSPGEVTHTAVVTAVMPDGDIKYTQHTPGRLDVSLDGRLPSYEASEGDKSVTFVRVNPTWAQ